VVRLVDDLHHLTWDRETHQSRPNPARRVSGDLAIVVEPASQLNDLVANAPRTSVKGRFSGRTHEFVNNVTDPHNRDAR
jgi:hypothetical protein